MNKKPNILYIMSDDHSANAISCYHSILAPVFKTPNMDRIGDEGVRLENYYATNSICTPARATIMTGQYGHLSGVRTLSDKLDIDNNINIAQIIKNEGYQTAMFGKWHLHCEPKGFDDYKYVCDAGGQGVYQNPAFMEKGKGEVRHTGYVSDIITDMTIDWMKERDMDKPFFIMCHHKAPHDFWEYPERHENLFDGIDIPVPDSLFEDKSHRSEASRDFGSSVSPRSKVRNLFNDFSKEDYVTGQLVVDGNATFEEKAVAAYQKYLKDYLRTVAGIDDSVGAILKHLEEEGELDNTLVVYTSDQGMFLGEHDYQDKRWSYEDSLRAPLLIRYPKDIKAGQVCDKLACNIDVAPMLLDYAGAKIPEEMQGVSLRNLVSGKEDEIRDFVYFRYWMHLAHRHHNPAHYGIRTNEYKIIFYYGLGLDASGTLDEVTPAGWELYDLVKDPLEMNNVYNNAEYKDIISDLKIKLAEAKALYKDEDEQYPEIQKRLLECE